MAARHAPLNVMKRIGGPSLDSTGETADASAMVAFEQIFAHKFPSGFDDVAALLNVRVATIAERHGLILENWEEDGLGAACGLLLKLASGRVVLFEELAHQIEHYGYRGPGIRVDAFDLVTMGADTVIDEVLAALGLDRSNLVWIAGEESRQAMAELLARRRSLCH